MTLLFFIGTDNSSKDNNHRLFCIGGYGCARWYWWQGVTGSVYMYRSFFFLVVLLQAREGAQTEVPNCFIVFLHHLKSSFRRQLRDSSSACLETHWLTDMVG